MADKRQARLRPELADFQARMRAISQTTTSASPSPASVDAFFGDDAPTSSNASDVSEASQHKAEAVGESDSDNARRELEQVHADLSRLGYSPADVARILAGTWESPVHPTRASIPTGGAEGVPIVSAVGKVLQRFRKKGKT